MFTHTGVLIEGRALRIEGIEYPLDLQLELLNLLLIIPGVWRVRTSSESPFDFICNPGLLDMVSRQG